MITNPQIEWDFKHMPANRDEMAPLGEFPIGKHVMLVAINCTRNELLFVWGDSYGKLVLPGVTP